MNNNGNIDAIINQLGFSIVENIKTYKGREKHNIHIDIGRLVNDGVCAYYISASPKIRMKTRKTFTKYLSTIL